MADADRRMPPCPERALYIVSMKRAVLRAILAALSPMLKAAARSRPVFREFLKRHDVVAQIQLQDGTIARHFVIAGGKIRSRSGLHPHPAVCLVFKDEDTALAMLRPNPDMGEIVHAAKTSRFRSRAKIHCASGSCRC